MARASASAIGVRVKGKRRKWASGGKGVSNRDDRRGLQRRGDPDEQLAHLDVEPAGDALKDLRRRVLLAAFDLRQVRDRDVGALGDLLQRESSLATLRPQGLSDGREKIPFVPLRTDLQSLHVPDSIFPSALCATHRPTL